MAKRRNAESWTYARSGVDVDSRSLSLKALLSEARYTPPSGYGRPLPVLGHYAGLTRIGKEVVAVTTDTVGTKVLLAEAMDEWESVGEDMVAINVNDLASVGARPFGLVDVISGGRPDPERFRAIGRGLGRGLRKGRCALLGGETAIVPEIVHGIDLGGTAVGFFPGARKPVTGRAVRAEDVLLGLRSTGFHSNGFTLLRRLLKSEGVDLDAHRPGARVPLGRELLRATRIYVPAVEAIVDRPGVHGLAHISGGGVRNLARLRDDLEFVLDRWPKLSGVFEWLSKLGKVAPKEMFQTFNMGVGFVVVVDPGHAREIVRQLGRAGASDVREIGRVSRGSGVSLPGLGLRYDGYD
ncbi:MAG: phosphoribosylformylglycinamidine cyclo-ligase [Thermoplasmata archaeon]|nr:phosphoribosylformylglycinamidine cyclo-ligase [Thermoplasmata archaeon]